MVSGCSRVKQEETRTVIRYLRDYHKFTIRAEDTTPNYGRSADGYGRKIPTNRLIRLEGEKRWRRVYAICFSNCASHYIMIGGDAYYIHDGDVK